MLAQTTVLPPPEFPVLSATDSGKDFFVPVSKSLAPNPAFSVFVSYSTAPRAATLSGVEPEWRDVFSARIERLRGLSRGWDGPGSVPVQGRLLLQAVQIVMEALGGSRKASPPSLVPGGDGSLQIEWHTELGEIEFDLAVNGRRSIWIHDRLTGEEIEGEDERALTLLSRWAAWYSKIPDNVADVPVSPYTSFFGVAAGASIYTDNPIT